MLPLVKSSRIRILIFLNLIFATSLQAQTVEDRVKVIRQMYAEVNDLHQSGLNSGCKQGSSGRESAIDHTGRNTFQKCSQCFYRGGYSKLTSRLVGWEFETNSEYYYKNGKLFFIYVVHYNVCGKSEFRYYFDAYGRSIRILEKPDDCDEEGVKINREVYNTQRKTELLNDANEVLRDALYIVK